MHKSEHDSLRQRATASRGHDDLRVRAGKELAQLPGVLSAQHSEVGIVPLLGLRQRWRANSLLGSRRRRNGVRCLRRGDVGWREPRAVLHGCRWTLLRLLLLLLLLLGEGVVLGRIVRGRLLLRHRRDILMPVQVALVEL